MSEHPLDGPRLKVERAYQHVDNVNAAIDAFWKANPCTMSLHSDGGGYVSVRLSRAAKFPKQISVLVGETVYQLRSALDVLACCLATANGAQGTAGVYFPFAKDAKEFELAATQRKIRKISSAAQDVIRSLKPYGGGNDLLCAVNALCNKDKHSRLLALASECVISDPAGATVPQWHAFDKEVTISRLFLDPTKQKMETQANFMLNIAFSEIQILERQPLVDSLKKICDVTQSAISSFVSFFPP